MSAEPTTIIRASGLPQWSDCPRRHAARSFSEDVRAQGYDLRTIPPSIGASIGTGTHAAVEFYLTEKLEFREAKRADLEARAVEAIDSDIADGVVWDDTTTSADTAHKQAIRQAISIIQVFGERLQPLAIEERLEASLGDGFMLSGTIDIREHLAIDDVKTGTVQRANQAQYGGYGLLGEANGHAIGRLTEIYVKRVGMSKSQPDPTWTDYPVAESKTAAWEIAQRIKGDLTAFRNGGDAWAFMPNPNSMMCSPDYCPAFGTNFCKAHKGELPDE